VGETKMKDNITYVEVTVECGHCLQSYDDVAEVTDVLAVLKDSICPICGHDNSGTCIIEPDWRIQKN
jgi:hypothetical protein